MELPAWTADPSVRRNQAHDDMMRPRKPKLWDKHERERTDHRRGKTGITKHDDPNAQEGQPPSGQLMCPDMEGSQAEAKRHHQRGKPATHVEIIDVDIKQKPAR
ncbi:hypothetical protein R1flu_004572 [Riccia fluitans]|uniref:Uncharacterized protein n=1 Tax=Riccia fluitans TaxID=41844 RepID=A0ABD1YQQ0_9MARC